MNLKRLFDLSDVSTLDDNFYIIGNMVKVIEKLRWIEMYLINTKVELGIYGKENQRT